MASVFRAFSGLILAASLCTAPCGPAQAAGKIDKAGKGIAIALPLIAGGLTLYKGDWIGTAELGATTFASVGSAYALKQVIHIPRPDGSDLKSFPSDTTALAFAPAQFLWDRYGWQFGVPAYAAAGFVAYSRVDAKKHRWSDVAASAGMAFVFGKLFTTRYRGRGFSYYGSATPNSIYAGVNYRF